MKSKKKDLARQEDAQERPKKPYITPQVTVHGTVEQITQAIAGPNTDGLGGSILSSDRNLKEHFAAVSMQGILARLMTLRIETWNYRHQHSSIRHIGPMAQDFHSAFGVGEDNRHINLVDANGVAIAAIQALYQMVEKQELQILALQTEMDDLKQRALATEARMSDSIPLTASTS